MFWADRIVNDIIERRGAGPHLIRDEKTLSGRVHIGSMRGVAIHGLLAEILAERGVPVTYKYEWNDNDPMDGISEELAERYVEHMGKSLRAVPAPTPGFENFAEEMGADFKQAIDKARFSPEYYRASELYDSGAMDEVIRSALLHHEDIKRIYREVSGSKKDQEWYPLQVVCEQCGKVGTTKVTAFDGEQVSYVCEPSMVTWAKGCGYTGRVAPWGGRGKLPWKVEWAAKWKVVGVTIEGAGKDHSTKGGSRDVANHISREVFGYEPPFDVPYEFFLVAGKKMSSSKGRGSTAREVSELFPSEEFRLALLGKDLNQAINFDPAGATVPEIYDQFDRLDALQVAGVEDDFTRLYRLCYAPEERAALPTRFLPRFSQVAFIAQMPHLSLQDEVAAMKGSALTSEDVAEAELRKEYAEHWLKTYAPEEFRFEFAKVAPALDLSAAQKELLGKIADFLSTRPEATGADMHEYLHHLKTGSPLKPAELFGPIYQALLARTSGPKAGWLLASLPREAVIARLREVAG